MPTAASPTIFRPVTPGQAVATLFLIENSKAMSAIWPHLRDQHIPTLLGAMRMANPIVPIQILLLTSCPDADEPTWDTPTPPRQPNGLPELRYNYRPDNKIYAHNIYRAIQLLPSTFQGLPTIRHLIIIAASSPSDDFRNVVSPGYIQWRSLSSKMAQEDIHCHMILNPNHNAAVLTDMFYETLRLQSNEEVTPWFSADPQRYTFHLSAKPINRVYRHEDVHGAQSAQSFASVAPPFEPPPLLRNNTFPPDSQASSTHADASEPPGSQSDIVTPSLVKRLQKMHGLTKKKVYGSQPSREPFFRPERIRDKHRHNPMPLSIPASVIPTSHSHSGAPPHKDAKPASRSRVDRSRRSIDKSPSATSIDTISTSPSGPWSRRNSIVSSSDFDSPLSSPTSVSMYGGFTDKFPSALSSPTISPSREMYTPLPILEQTEPPSISQLHTVSSPMEPTWLENQHVQPTSALSGSVPAAFAPMPVGSTLSGTTGAAPSGLVAMSPTFAAESSSCDPLAEMRQFTTCAASEVPTVDDGDRPFIFCAEYEAAATARLQAAVLKSSTSNVRIPAAFTSIERSAESALQLRSPANHVTSSAAAQPLPQLYHSISRPLLTQAEISYDGSLDQTSSSPPLLRNSDQTLSAMAPSIPPYVLKGNSALNGWSG